jgi:hypothetical protein
MPTADHQREAYEHYGYGYATEVPPGEEELRVRRIEEELRIGTREREAGSVSVRKQGATPYQYRRWQRNSRV